MKKAILALFLVWAVIGAPANIRAIDNLPAPSVLDGYFLQQASRRDVEQPVLSAARQETTSVGSDLRGVSTAERNILMDLYNSANGADWVDNTGWGGDAGTECQWYGITCADDQVTGPLPDELMNLSNLASPSIGPGSTFSWNALYTDDRDLEDFLNKLERFGDWTATQTIAPANLAADSISGNQVLVSWDPIPYTDDDGGYEVYYNLAELKAGDGISPWILYGKTDDKTRDSLLVAGLAPLTSYQFRVQAFTEPHAGNLNTIYSQFSEAV